jgi:hypothetical protein
MRTDGPTGRQAGMTELVLAFRNFATRLESTQPLTEKSTSKAAGAYG